MPKFDFDLFVIGGGSGGVRAGRLAASMGKRVAIAEEYRFGGTCVIRGCVPKKLFVYASQFPEHFQDAAGYGWTVGETRFDWPLLVANKNLEIARLEALYRKGLENAGARIFEARAVLLDPHTVQVGGSTVTAETILIATGSRPNPHAALPGNEHCIFSNEAFDLEELPRSIAIEGGGYIAVEFANIFHGLGVDDDARLPRQGNPRPFRRRPTARPARGDGSEGYTHPLPGHFRGRREARRRAL